MYIYIFKKLYIVLKFKTELKFKICAFYSEKVYCSKRLDHPGLRSLVYIALFVCCEPDDNILHFMQHLLFEYSVNIQGCFEIWGLSPVFPTQCFETRILLLL